MDELFSNQKHFNNQKFVLAFQTNQENELNFKFVRALKNNLNSESHKEALIQWGQSLKAQIESLDFREKNRKYSKYDRTTFYNNIEAIY